MNRVSTTMPASLVIRTYTTRSPWVPWGQANLLLNCEGLLEQPSYCLLSPMLFLRTTFLPCPQSPCPELLSCFLLDSHNPLFISFSQGSSSPSFDVLLPISQPPAHLQSPSGTSHAQEESASLRNGQFHDKPLETGQLWLRRYHTLIAYNSPFIEIVQSNTQAVFR